MVGPLVEMHPQVVQQVVPLGEHELAPVEVALQDHSRALRPAVAELVHAVEIGLGDLVSFYSDLVLHYHLAARHHAHPHLLWQLRKQLGVDRAFHADDLALPPEGLVSHVRVLVAQIDHNHAVP